MNKKQIDLKDKIFVAGHNGMAGKSIIKNLKAKGYKNIIYEDKSKLDLKDSDKVKKWFISNKPDIVIDAAAKVGGILANKKMPADFLFENLKIQLNLIENAWENNAKRLLFLGSSCIYPKFSKQPIKEEYLLEGQLEETNESYAIAKIAGIKMCSSLRNQFGFDAISLMPTNLYGPGDNYHLENSHVLPAFIRRFHDAKVKNLKEVICWGSGLPLREFLHVDDLGDAAVFLLENWFPNKNELNYINVGTGVDITIKELSEKISEIMNYKGNIIWDESKPDGTFKKQLDVSRINRIGWESKISLEDGLRDTINNYVANLNKNNIRF